MSKGTRDPASLAQFSIADGGVFLGEADGDGRFSFDVPPGELTIEVSAPAHRRRVVHEKLEPGQEVEVLYRLDAEFTRPYETVVRGNVDRTELARHSLTGAEAHEVAGTSGDPIRTVMLLPGVTTLASGLSYPVVRGSSPAATGFYLDGVKMPQLYHLLALTPVVHPNFIESVDFFPANAPTRFGRVSGGVVSLQTAKPRSDRFHLTVSPDLIGTSAYAEIPIVETGTNITVAGTVTYAAWVLGIINSAVKFDNGMIPTFESYDYQARIEQKVGKGNVRLLAFGSSDVGGFRAPESPNGLPNALLATSRFHRIDLRGQLPLGPGVIEVGTNVGWDTIGLDGEDTADRKATFLLNRFLATARANYRAQVGEHFQLKAGFDFEHQNTSSTVTFGIGKTGELLRQPNVQGRFTGSFVEAAFLSDKWTATAGVRVDTWHLAPSFTLVSADPRIDMRFQPIPELTLRANAGLAHQAPMLLMSLPVSDVAALGSGLQEVGQLGLGATTRFEFLGNLEASIDGFYNHHFQARERSLNEFVTGVSTLDDDYVGARWGRSYGLELMLRLPQQGRFFGWASYTLMRSERMRRFATFDENQFVTGERTAMLPFTFDQAHTLNITAGIQLPHQIKLGASFHLHTGRPESGDFGSRTMRLIDDGSGSQQWQPVPLDQVDRLPAFVRVDARVSKTVNFSVLNAELYLDVMNTFGIPEVLGNEYLFEGAPGSLQGLKRPLAVPVVLPTFGVKVNY
ncbi:MAG: TonB-dependent receptor [Archangium sp.]|nr:TonB-dependent receptor [Archangium sp.]